VLRTRLAVPWSGIPAKADFINAPSVCHSSEIGLLIRTSTFDELFRIESNVLKRLLNSSDVDWPAVAVLPTAAVEKTTVRRNHGIRCGHVVGGFGNNSDLRRHKYSIPRDEILELRDVDCQL